jgi:hypothetical protein
VRLPFFLPLSSLPVADLTPPRTARSVAAPGSSEILAAMRDTITEQSKELDELRELVHQLQQERDEEVRLLSPSFPPFFSF